MDKDDYIIDDVPILFEGARMIKLPYKFSEK
jgi:hypothetical protein